MSGDVRKDFILTTVANYFALSVTNLSGFGTAKELNNFLDDGNHYVLLALKKHGKEIQVS